MQNVLSFASVFCLLQPIIGPLMQHLGIRNSVIYWGSQVIPQNIYNSKMGFFIFAAIELQNSYFSAVCVYLAVIILYIPISIILFWLKFIKYVHLFDLFPHF